MTMILLLLLLIIYIILKLYYYNYYLLFSVGVCRTWIINFISVLQTNYCLMLLYNYAAQNVNAVVLF